ncbi:MAG: transglutaminase [Gemmataceae bacterium]|nr:transglutaminase [Gemmataceae bacterium]
MARLLWSVVVVLMACPVPARAQAPPQKIEVADRQTVAASITYEIRTTTFAVARWTAFLPEPPELPSQTKVKTTASPGGKVVAEKSPLARKVRVIDVPVANPMPGARLPLRLDVQATLRTRKLVPLKDGEKPPAVAPLTATEKRFYLAPSPRVDFDLKTFRDWLDKKTLRRKKGESAVDFATRVVAVLRADFDYRYDPLEEKRASVSCGRAATDCGGMAFMFVGAMRANDVPARVLVGRLARPRKPGVGPADTDYDQPHVRAEFYVGGIGWVPVDPAYANNDKTRPVEAFVGDDPGDMLVLHVDLELKLPFADKDRTADLLQLGPYYRATGVGPFDGAFGPTGWDVKTVPAGER